MWYARFCTEQSALEVAFRVRRARLVQDLLTSRRSDLPTLITQIPVRLLPERFMKQATRPRNRIRVLVVEDEALSRHALCQVLHRSGFFSAGAADGSQALDMVKFFHPQVIIMDLRMPRLDGFEATRRLKADRTTADIPVLALTGSTDPDDRRQALDAGVDTFLNKPINLDQLMLYLRQHQVDSPCPAKPNDHGNGN